ncbi:DAK2 domain-containing protein [Nocardia sp. NPDC056100]|uniref:DAK2 domain-containing protein n=1 Tax=Nocardia sp. NPDC056100 TaxID=3345712 RepID=UPI0035E1A97A
MCGERTVPVPGVGDVLDGEALLRWGQACLSGLERHRDEINALNVFPVADSDTGTNLLATMRAAIHAAEEAANRVTTRRIVEPAGLAAVSDSARAEAESTVVPGLRVATVRAAAGSPEAGGGSSEGAGGGLPARVVASAMARAATIGARGNSGIILSQVLRGMADAVRDEDLTEATLRLALRRAARLVRGALSSPVEGTMLTVLDRAADHAAECTEPTLNAVALAAADGAAKALGETTSQLGVLRRAGVVDAGARGLLVLLDELVVATGGQAPDRPEYLRQAERAVSTGSGGGGVIGRGVAGRGGAAGSGGIAAEGPAGAGDRRGEVATGPIDRVAGAGAGSLDDSAEHANDGVAHVLVGGAPHYEVMFLLTGADEAGVAELREKLGGLGDSVVVVGDGVGTWSAHVHCADAGAAVEAGIAAGELSGIRIETLAAAGPVPLGSGERGILAVATGDGVVRLFEDAGAQVLQGRVTAESLLAGIRRLPHREVLVLPNGALPAHELMAVSVAARDGNRDVLMLPSGSMVQGLAALSMHDAGRAAADDVFAMSEAAAGTRWGALRIAPERALTIVGMCDAGDGLGLVGHDVVVIDPDPRAAGRTLLDRMLGLGGELVTMLIGADAPQGLSQELAEHIGAAFPGVEVVTYPGGQAGDLVQIGVE